MRGELRVDRDTKIVLTLIVILLAALLCKPFFIAKPVTAYNTTADDAYYHADEAYYLADEALEKAKKAYSYADEAYSHADSAYYRAEEAHKKADEASSRAYRAESRTDEAYKKAEEAWDKARVAEDNAYYYAERAEGNAYWRMKRELPKAEIFEAIGFLIRSNREDLVKLGEKLEIAVSTLEELVKEFEEARQVEE